MDGAAADAGKGREQDLGGSAVPCEERADLETLAAGPGDAVAGDAVLPHRHEGDMRRAQPLLQESPARCREEAAIEGGDGLDEIGRHRPDRAGRGGRRREATAVADGAIGRDEAHAAVVGLLCGHAVETDGTAREPRHAGIPHGLPVAPAAPIRPADVEPDEAERLPVGDGRDAGDHLAIHEGAEEAARIRGMEGSSIGEAGIPAFARRPVDQRLDLSERQRAYRRRLRHHATALSSIPKPARRPV